MKIKEYTEALALGVGLKKKDRKYLLTELENRIKELDIRTIKGYSEYRDYYRALKITYSMKRSRECRVNRFIVATLMKSGTKHLENCLSSVYKLERYTPPIDFEDVRQSPSRIKPVFLYETEFMFGESFASYHLYPGEDLIKLAYNYRIPILVLLRNPAQALVSHYYYCEKNNFSIKQTLTPGEYFGLRYEENCEFSLKQFLLQNTLPRAIEFVDSWLTLEEKSKSIGLEVKVLFHEELVNNSDRYYNKLNEALAINTEEELNANSFKDVRNHNKRKGSTSEWLTFFNPQEVQYLRDRIEKLKSKHSQIDSIWQL